MEFRQIIRPFLRWWWLIIILTFVGGLAGIFFVQIQHKRYIALTTLLVTNGRPSRSAVTMEDLNIRQQLAITYKELLVKGPVIEAAAAQLGIDPAEVSQAVKVDLVRDTSILELSATSTDSQLAANVANAVVQAFIAQEHNLLNTPYTTGISGLTVVEPAVPPMNSASISPLLATVLGSMLGMLIGLGITFAMGYFDTSIHSAYDVARLTGMSTLSVITHIRGRVANDKLITQHSPESVTADAYRMVRTQLEFASTDRLIRTIVVTSTRQSEGKSITAANVAIALAQTGLRVILVDANLRRPALHLLFQCPNTRGLTTALQELGHGRTIEHITPTPIEHLSLLLSGPPPLNATGLLVPERIRMLTVELQDYADILVFDGPQCQDVIDTTLLLRNCDAALLVVLAHTTKAAMLRRTYAFLQASQTYVLGTILNQVRGLHHQTGDYPLTPQASSNWLATPEPESQDPDQVLPVH